LRRSRAVLCLGARPTAGIVDITNPVPTPISAIFDHLRSLGYPLDAVPAQEWADR
jgi:hypothetical protein